MTGLRVGQPRNRVSVPGKNRLLSFSSVSRKKLDPSSLLCDVHWALSSGEESEQILKLTIYLHLLPNLRTNGVLL